MRKGLFIAMLACVAGSWAATLEEGFQTVPMADRPWAYWWWVNGHVDRASITRDLEAMKRVGFGGLLLFDARGYWDDKGHVVLPKPELEFMSEEWRKLIVFSVKEADRLGLKVSINLSSCAGALKGPWPVGADAPKQLMYQVQPLAAGAWQGVLEKPQDRPYFWDVGVYAVNYSGASVTNSGWHSAGDGLYTMSATSGKRLDAAEAGAGRIALEVIDLSGKTGLKGLLKWQVPSTGNWALVRLAYTTIDGHEYDVDVLDATAVEGHFQRMGQQLLADVGELAGKTLSHFYSVSWEGAVPTWTGSFDEDFTRYRGYSIRPWLPILAGFRVGSEAETATFITDYRRARNELFRDNFYGKMKALSNANGLQWHSESGGPWHRNPAIFGEADQLAFLARNDMPQGEFWFTGRPDCIGRQMSRPQASVGHTYGKRLIAAEAFTHMVRHWSAYPAVLKRAADESFCDGVNHLIWHTFTCIPDQFGTPGTEYFAGTHINPRVTWFEQGASFVQYLGRCQWMLRQGLFVADAAVYCGDVPYQHWGRYSTNWTDSATLSLPKGYAYDIFSNEVLLERTRVENKQLVLPDNMRYRMLIVDLEKPEANLAVLKKIAEIRAAGVPVVFGTRKPLRAAGHTADNPQIAALAETLWKEPGRVTQALDQLVLKPDVEGPVEWTHRQSEAGDIYFVAGRGAATCTFRVTGKQPEVWDPVTGSLKKPLQWSTTADQRTQVTFSLPEFGSAFVVFRSAGETAGNIPEPRVVKQQLVEGRWDVTFQAGRGAPERVVFDPLCDWTTHADAGVRHFSGTARYTKTITLTDAPTKSVRLQLGAVSALAQVRVNGKDCGVVWTAPWCVEIGPALKVGDNVIEIDVTNTWVNRLIGDAGVEPEARITKSNMAFEKGKRTLKVYQGFASEDALMPSGLVGPVVLEWVE